MKKKYSYSSKINTGAKNSTEADNINFKGRCANVCTVLGAGLGACFGPIGLAIGAIAGNKYGKMIDKGSDEFEHSGFETDNENDPDNYSGR